MMAAAFAGVAAIKGSDDSDADADNSTVINPLSGTVDYVPGTVNVYSGGSASFIPTINWVTATSGGYTVELTVGISLTDSLSPYGTEGVEVMKDSNSVALVSFDGSKVTVEGSSVSSNLSGSFWVQSTATIKHGDTTIATRTVSQQVSVTTYTNVSLAVSNIDCYFGQALAVSLASGGSGDYAITISNGSDALPAGLYLINNALSGYADRGSFGTDDVTKRVIVTIVDTVSGETVTSSTSNLEIVMHLYNVVSVSVGGSNTASGSTIYADEGDTVTATIAVQDTTTTLTMSTDGGTPSSVTSNTTGTEVVLPTTVIGLHTYVLTYNVGDTYTGTYTFYMLVVESDEVFIIPDPSISITVL